MVTLDRILDPDFLGDLRTVDMDTIRTLRSECRDVETGMSYLRRLVQGRMDIVATEVERRTTGSEGLDLAELIARLPEVLAEKTRSAGNGRLSDSIATGAVDAALAEELDEIASPISLTDPSELADADLAGIGERLAAFERKVSDLRRSLFDRIDALEDELTRRYRSGEETVDGLLR